MIYKTLHLSELTEIGDGNHSSNYPKASEMVKEGVPFLRSGNIQDGKIIDDNLKFISPEKHQILKKGHIKTGDILFTNRGEIGKIGIVDERFNNANLNSQVAWIRVGNQLYNRYLYYYLSSSAVKLFFLKAKTGTALQQITIKQLKSLLISFPDFSEQQRIVAKLDAIFAEVDKGIAISYRKQEEVDKLKQSILESTFVYGVDNKKLGDVCDIIGGGTPSKSKASYYYGDIPWATVRDMSFDEISSTQHKITKLGLKKSSSNLIPKNNIIIASRVGLGKVCILKQDTAINQDLRGIIPKKEGTIKRKYLFYWFKSISNKIITAGRGATVQGVRLPFLKSLFLPLPSLAEQKRIVEKLDSVFKENEVVIKATKKQIINYKALKSIIIFNQLQKEAT